MSSAVNYGVSDMCTASASATAPFNGRGSKGQLLRTDRVRVSITANMFK